jgi:hypothetical protein
MGATGRGGKVGRVRKRGQGVMDVTRLCARSGDNGRLNREANMARICIEATPSDSLRRYELRVDEYDTDFVTANNQGCIDIEGTCGDGSTHYVYYALVGPVGATLGLKVYCDETLLVDIPLSIRPPGPIQGGDVEFRL